MSALLCPGFVAEWNMNAQTPALSMAYLRARWRAGRSRESLPTEVHTDERATVGLVVIAFVRRVAVIAGSIERVAIVPAAVVVRVVVVRAVSAADRDVASHWEQQCRRRNQEKSNRFMVSSPFPLAPEQSGRRQVQ